MSIKEKFKAWKDKRYQNKEAKRLERLKYEMLLECIADNVHKHPDQWEIRTTEGGGFWIQPRKRYPRQDNTVDYIHLGSYGGVHVSLYCGPSLNLCFLNISEKCKRNFKKVMKKLCDKNREAVKKAEKAMREKEIDAAIEIYCNCEEDEDDK